MMSRRGLRRTHSRLFAALAAILVAVATVAVPPAQAAPECAEQQQPLFAVDASTGHLMEMTACPSDAAIGPAGEVDGDDWRNYPRVFGTHDGTTVVLYMVTDRGALLSRRQDAPYAAFGPPVQVGAAIDWSGFGSVFAGPPGYLYAAEHPGPVRAFRHGGWFTGGSMLFEELPLLSRATGWPMTAVTWGAFGESIRGNVHARIWRNPDYPEFSDSDDLGFSSGWIQHDVSGVVGVEPWLYGIDVAGDVVLLDQDPDDPDSRCGNENPWIVVARSSGEYARVVAPTGPQIVPPGGRRLAARVTDGNGEMCPMPLEWQ
jgi:hypothetical protein